MLLLLHKLYNVNVLYDTCLYFPHYRLSASCVHVSALLHALVHMFSVVGAPPETDVQEESVIPVTSLACKWVQPRKQKEKALKVSEVWKSMERYLVA